MHQASPYRIIPAAVLAAVLAAAALPGPAQAATPPGTSPAASPSPSDTPLAAGLKAVDAGQTKLALDRLNAALDGGEADAGFYLGRLAETGVGVPVDIPKAFELYKAAAARGSRKALNRLGVLALEGKLVKQDLVLGRTLVCEAAAPPRGSAKVTATAAVPPVPAPPPAATKAAAKAVPNAPAAAPTAVPAAPVDLRGGDPDAAFNCAGVLADGRGGPADLAQALAYYQAAAGDGHLGAQVALGFAHGRGLGTPKDLRQAQGHFERAAARGNPIALYELGQMFEIGTSVASDRARAHTYYTLAAAKGHTDAAAGIARMARSLSAEQLEASRTAVLSWRPVGN
jgi:uncharacterized protein